MKNSLESSLQIDFICSVRIFNILEVIRKLSFFKNHKALNPNDGQLWSQKVSATPATRLDVQRLATQLDRKLLQRQARETGICPIRRELYKQTFDEVIRQV